MSRIRGKNTLPEIIVRKFLHSNGLRFRIHSKNLPGKPDLFLRKFNTAIFINGCFWHGHKGCKYFVIPKTRTSWWKKKIDGNRKNDRKKRLALKTMGIKVVTVWECELKPAKKEKRLDSLLKQICL